MIPGTSLSHHDWSCQHKPCREKSSPHTLTVHYCIHRGRWRQYLQPEAEKIDRHQLKTNKNDTKSSYINVLWLFLHFFLLFCFIFILFPQPTCSRCTWNIIISLFDTILHCSVKLNLETSAIAKETPIYSSNIILWSCFKVSEPNVMI